MTMTSTIIRQTSHRLHSTCTNTSRSVLVARSVSACSTDSRLSQHSGAISSTVNTSSSTTHNSTFCDNLHYLHNPLLIHQRHYSTTVAVAASRTPITLSSASVQTKDTPPNNPSNPNSPNEQSTSSTAEEGKREPLSSKDYNPKSVESQLIKACKWNQGNTGKGARWDPRFCAQAIERYEAHLNYISDRKKEVESSKSETFEITKEEKSLLSSYITTRALKTVLKMKLPTPKLAEKIRQIERLIGSIGHTPLSNQLSLALLEANGKAGNVGRSLSLLNLRKAREFPPVENEFEYVVQSIISAGLYLRQNRNVFLKDGDQPDIDNPTRWLDAILLNMSSRKPKGVQLSTELANKMLGCYASTGRSGKAVHFFYDVKRDPVMDDGKYYGSWKEVNDGKKQAEQGSDGESSASTPNTTLLEKEHKVIPEEILEQMPKFKNRKAKVRMRMRQHLPPYYKFPSDVKLNPIVKIPEKDGSMTKLQMEQESDFSLSLTAAFAFAESLTYGACGHDPISLDVRSWNTLIKACCYRGAIWRALQIINETMPKNGIQPDSFSYNTLLAGIARLGDKDYMKEILTTMTNSGITVDKYTVQALVDGHLNAGDVSGANTIVQDLFNQHQTLPPYTTHLKIIEFALANDLLFEAKRHVYFIQQLWKWTASEWHSEELVRLVNLAKSNPKLSKDSLKRLFAYFGEELLDEDFF